MNKMNQLINIALMVIVTIFFLQASTSFAWNIGNVFQGMSTNITRAGSYQDQAAGYYSAGGLSMRTSKSSFNPIAMTAPSLTMSCSGIDAYAGSWSIISGNEVVQLGKNIMAQAPLTAFSIGLKTYAPGLENTMKDIRNLAMELNRFAKNDCEITKAIFATALPKDSAMRETVCKDVQSQSGGVDYFAAGKKCRSDLEQKQAIAKAQVKDPELMLDDYNIFTKAAEKAGIPADMRASIMSMTGTIVIKNKSVHFFDSLAKDEKSWITHLKGGESASIYSCDNQACLNPALQRNISITAEQSYQGKAKSKLTALKEKFYSNTQFDTQDIAFLSSIGDTFPIYDYITLEAISGVTILDSSSELLASYTLVHHLKEVISEIRTAVILLRSKQIEDQHLINYLKALDRVQIFAAEKWGQLLTNADQIETKARRIEQILIAKERS